MAAYGILVDYEWCSGCRACEVACQMEHGLPPDRFGVVVAQLGPWQIEGDRWQHAFTPNFTDECDLCAGRTGAGKLPSWVHHCQAAVLTYGTDEQLAAQLAGKPRQLLVCPC